MRSNAVIGVVTHRKIMVCYLCYTHTPAFPVSLFLEESE